MADPVKIPKSGGAFRRTVVLGLTACAAVAVGAWYMGVIPPARPLEPLVAEAAPVLRRIQALGEVLPASNIVTISAPTGPDAGRIALITVSEGDAVAAGQSLAVLDTEPLLRAQLDQAKANEAVRAAAVDVRIADLDATARQLETQIGQHRAALGKAQLLLDRRMALTDSGLYEDTALRDMQLDVEAATYTLANLQVQLERTRMTSPDGVRLDEASARAELAAATAARSKAEADYAKAFIRAPMDGRILAVFGRVGQQIDSDGFGEMGDTGRMKIRAEVYETDIPAIGTGQAVTATSRALETELQGSVHRIGVRISGQSILSTDPAAIVDARVVEVWITLDAASSAVVADRSGLQVTVAFASPEDGNA